MASNTSTSQKRGLSSKLPGELRNRIYYHALPIDYTIRVITTPFTEPALLQTCKAIREETLDIFYLENDFEIDCRDWGHTVWKDFHYRTRDLAGEEISSQMTTYWVNTGMLRHKRNLMAFLKDCHQDPILSAGMIPLHVKDQGHIVSGTTGAFEIVKTMKSLPWTDVDKVLEIYFGEITGRGPKHRRANPNIMKWKWTPWTTAEFDDLLVADV